jgi:hypothetical protein
VAITLKRYSIGIGDRFGREGQAQLEAIIRAKKVGIDLDPVWNKSYREHTIIGTSPKDVRQEANAAVKAKAYKGNYFVDADHIGLKNVDHFIEYCDFFTIDVADFIGATPDPDQIDQFVRAHQDLCGHIDLPGLDGPIMIRPADVRRVAGRFLCAIQEAARIYRHILAKKGSKGFVVEVSMDEADQAQGPVELLLILAGLADEGVPVQTIAPRFSGRFNKGVDYVGDLSIFERQFRQGVAAVAFAQGRFALPEGLKLSVHSGSDKFSLYPIIRSVLQESGAGLHIKTAGTTWLEELVCLAQAGGEGLEIARYIYAQALGQMEQLCRPYATVVDIDPTQLPSAAEVNSWPPSRLVAALRHEPGSAQFNPHMRQLVHVAYKCAAELGKRFLDALDANRTAISEAVTYNLLERHIKAVFPASS